MKIERCVNNPLLTPADVKPSRQDFKVDGVFNCGVTEYKGEVILLCRVAESVICKNEDEVCVPIVKKQLLLQISYRESNRRNNSQITSSIYSRRFKNCIWKRSKIINVHKNCAVMNI